MPKQALANERLRWEKTWDTLSFRLSRRICRMKCPLAKIPFLPPKTHVPVNCLTRFEAVLYGWRGLLSS